MNEIIDNLVAAADFLDANEHLADNLRTISVNANGAHFTVVGDAAVVDAWEKALIDDDHDPVRMPETIDQNGQLLNEIRSHPFKVAARRAAVANDWLRLTGGPS